jgi:hypothetical protein
MKTKTSGGQELINQVTEELKQRPKQLRINFN